MINNRRKVISILKLSKNVSDFFLLHFYFFYSKFLGKTQRKETTMNEFPEREIYRKSVFLQIFLIQTFLQIKYVIFFKLIKYFSTGVPQNPNVPPTSFRDSQKMALNEN